MTDEALAIRITEKQADRLDEAKGADAYIAQLNAAKVYRKPIVTKVGPLEAFYPAEAYHQDYLTLQWRAPCS